MAYKSIDFQASLPRAVEMTPLAHQQQHKPISEQTALGQQQLKSAEQQSHRSAKTESATGGTINDRDPGDGADRQAPGKRRKPEGRHDSEAKPADHPYKGKHIDFMG
ncbi:hypothetical protein [Cohnella sp. GCM10027633]|uniref:hypothetical protein n=1 Tax=unclassified Cohnella TaxID=2636738 RepID=UPI003627320E